MVTNTNTLQGTTNNTQMHMPTCTPADAHVHIYQHHTTLCYSQEVASVCGEHTERFAGTVCVDLAVLT